MAPFLLWMEEFDEFFNRIGDEETSSWPLMQSASTMILLSLTYIFIVTSIGPKLMENRKPYNLKGIIMVYNTFQVIACFILVAWMLQNKPTFACIPVNREKNDETITVARICWWCLLLKIVELVETVFFVLRKKQNQISALHVYHHASTFLILWGATKVFPSKMAYVPIGLNCFVHFLMYIYYLLSAMGPSVQMKISKWKKYLTIVQMVQFTAILIHSVQSLSSTCDVPWLYSYIFIPNVFIVFYMFYKFYREAYLGKKQKLKQ